MVACSSRHTRCESSSIAKPHALSFTTGITPTQQQVIPQPAMVGFMNALAIILVKGQIDAFEICTNVRLHLHTSHFL